jgi:hypothetical protein
MSPRRTNDRVKNAQDSLERMLERIAPYSPRPPDEEEDEPPLRWVNEQGEEELNQKDL